MRKRGDYDHSRRPETMTPLPDPSEGQGPPRRLRAVEEPPLEARLSAPQRPDRQPRHNNLPLALSTFVGREREVAEVGRLVGEEKARLVTLTGPGGSGKTRLALAVAAKVVEDFGGGAWLVELAPLSDPTLVPQAVASALGVREAPGRALDEALVEHLEERDLLLILDNCEHLIEACAAHAERLLRACQNLTILATSREALALAGEICWAVPPLSSPADLERLPPLEELRCYEAVQLFVERAKSASGFVLTEENAPAVTRLCRRLEGIPLALELAAARTKVLSVGQILGRLEDSLGLLAGRDRAAPARQRTLRGTLDWSYELLSEQERELFGRLSVFRGGWLLKAAEAVGSGQGIERGDVLDLLSGLVDKSLVVSEAGEGGAARYRMLEPVRQYGRERLEESGEAGYARDRHAAWFLALAERAEPELKGRQQLAWLKRLEKEHENLRFAMRWMLDEGEVETAVRLAWALWFFWYLHGHQSEGYRYAGDALEKGATLPAGLRAKALCVRGIMSYGLESIEQTKQLFEASVALFRRTEGKFGLAIALSGVGVTAMQQGDMQRATALFEEVLKLYREVGNKWGVSNVLVHLGMVPLNRGDHERAARYFEEALAISRDIGDRLSGYTSLYSLALSSREQGDHERAAELYAQGLGLAVEAGDNANAAYCLEGLAGLIAARNELRRAARLFGAAEAILEAVGAPRYVQAQDHGLYERSVEALRSGLGETALEAAWAEGRAMALEQAVEYALKPPPTTPGLAVPPAHPAGLSAREVEVLKLVAKGLTNAQVAQELFISPHTVSRHLNSIYGKLGFSSRAGAARFAAEHGLL